MMVRLAQGILLLAVLTPRAMTWRDLPEAVQRALAHSGLGAATFSQYIEKLDGETARRLREGEHDHLIFYILQSQAFTKRPRIEPALSARALVERLPAGERACYLADPPCVPPSERIPPDARARLDDFRMSPRTPSTDERLNYFRDVALSGLDMQSEYLRAMRFLYKKEFILNRQTSAVNALYASRGHSSDTTLAANYAVWNALAVLRGIRPEAQLNRVLIVGPGLDLAPRTRLVDSIPPQSYQPFAVMDALIGLSLSRSADLDIQCYDINPRVIQFLRRFPQNPRLFLTTEPGDPEYEAYARKAGSSIGERTPASLVVGSEYANRVTASNLNIVTQRPAGAPQFDLVVATNVLLYFEGHELLLGLTNIAALLKPGGYLIHNDMRPALDANVHLLNLHAIAARTLRLSPPKAADPLYDTFAIYQR
ncbi:MAG: class I SAM-dependent methyltransferase [Acidobacteriota bacterium]|nr:class I SAM-dependent methyltransferase [Acidobacteriota bacterium]